jgi:hypothetical protein
VYFRPLGNVLRGAALYENYRSSQNFWLLFTHGKSYVWILTKNGLGTAWAIFYKLIWSLWLLVKLARLQKKQYKRNNMPKVPFSC